MMITEGYGPKDLVDDVKGAAWIQSNPNGFYFTGIDFKGNLLVSKPDEFLLQKYRAIFFEVPRGSGDECEVTGYHSENLIEQLKRNQGIEVSFGDSCIILSSSNNLYQNAYRLLLDKI